MGEKERVEVVMRKVRGAGGEDDEGGEGAREWRG